MIERGEFLEWAKVHNNFYGTAFETVNALRHEGHDILLDLDVQGVRTLRQAKFPGVFILLLPPSIEELQRRLKSRNTESAQAIQDRIDVGKKEMTQYGIYDYVITNTDLDETVANLVSIIRSERCSASRYQPTFKIIENKEPESNLDLSTLVREKVKNLKAYHVENIDCAVKLHANENPFPPPAELLATLEGGLQGFKLNRYPDPGCSALRQTIAQRLQVAADKVVVGNGSDEIIQLIMQVFCDAGEKIAFPDPTFAMYAIIAEGLGLHPVPYPLDNRWDFQADSLMEMLEKQNPKILFFSFPNNPTGNCFNQTEIKKVIERFRGIVVADEAYYDFSKKSFIQDLGKHNNLIVLRSLSKIGLAGLRVGYGVADTYIIEQINKIRLPYNSNTVSQTISEKVLSNFSPIQKQIDWIIQERGRLIQELSKIKSLTVYPSDSNFILFRANQQPSTLFKKLMEKGILIRDLDSHPRMKGCMRVTIGSREENDQFLAQVEALTQLENIRV